MQCVQLTFLCFILTVLAPDSGLQILAVMSVELLSAALPRCASLSYVTLCPSAKVRYSETAFTALGGV